MLLGSWWVAFTWVKSYSLRVLSSFLPTVSSKSLLQGLVSVSKLILQHSLSDAEGKRLKKDSSPPTHTAAQAGQSRLTILSRWKFRTRAESWRPQQGGCPRNPWLWLVHKGCFSATKGTKSQRIGARVQVSTQPFGRGEKRQDILGLVFLPKRRHI